MAASFDIDLDGLLCRIYDLPSVWSTCVTSGYWPRLMLRLNAAGINWFATPFERCGSTYWRVLTDAPPCGLRMFTTKEAGSVQAAIWFGQREGMHLYGALVSAGWASIAEED